MGGYLFIYPMKTCVLMRYNSLNVEIGIEGNRAFRLKFPNPPQLPWYQNRIPRLNESLAYYGYGSPVINTVISFHLHFYIILKINSKVLYINFIPY